MTLIYICICCVILQRCVFISILTVIIVRRYIFWKLDLINFYKCLWRMRLYFPKIYTILAMIFEQKCDQKNSNTNTYKQIDARFSDTKWCFISCFIMQEQCDFRSSASPRQQRSPERMTSQLQNYSSASPQSLNHHLRWGGGRLRRRHLRRGAAGLWFRV